MATDKGKGAGRGRGRGKEKGKGENGDGDDGERHGPGKHHGGDPVRIHEEYARHHVGGGAPPTPEAYERAIEQFNKLPGAFRTPTKGSPPRPVPKPDDDGSEPAENKPEEPPS
jgi:hypothetical protein